jgi:hypothetical protein
MSEFRDRVRRSWLCCAQSLCFAAKPFSIVQFNIYVVDGSRRVGVLVWWIVHVHRLLLIWTRVGKIIDMLFAAILYRPPFTCESHPILLPRTLHPYPPASSNINTSSPGLLNGRVSTKQTSNERTTTHPSDLGHPIFPQMREITPVCALLITARVHLA